MTHDELEAIRLRAAETAQYLAPYGTEHPAYVRQHAASYPATNSALDVPALLAYIDELHGVVHDLRQEPGWELGRQEERREVLALLDYLTAEWDHSLSPRTSLHVAMGQIRELGPVAPHLAPDDLRRENEALRAALRGLLSSIANVSNIADLPNLGVWVSAEHIGGARRLLGEV